MPQALSALPDGEIPENSCKHLLTKMKATEPAWAAMMAQETCPEVDATFKLMFIADQDEASRIGSTFADCCNFHLQAHDSCCGVIYLP